MRLTPLLSVLTLTFAPAFGQVSDWAVDPAHSAAQFSVRHLMVSNVRGHFGKISGTISFDPAEPSKSSVNVTVDVASIDTREPKRDAHLKSEDFFHVEKFPTMTFRSTAVRAVAPSKLKMTGDLTIHGVTRQVTFDVDGPNAPVNAGRGTKSGASATAVIKRSDFGMTWNRAIEAGGVTVGDEVAITVDVELNKAAPKP